MNDNFTIRVRSAAVASWWTVLVAVGFAVFLFVAGQALMHARPNWVMAMWGPEVTWGDMERTFLWVLVAFRFFVWLLALAAVWLTLWSWQLKKRVAAAA